MKFARIVNALPFGSAIAIVVSVVPSITINSRSIGLEPLTLVIAIVLLLLLVLFHILVHVNFQFLQELNQFSVSNILKV